LLESAQHIFLKLIAERSRPGDWEAASAVSPKPLPRKKFRRFIIAVISPIVQIQMQLLYQSGQTRKAKTWRF
jgi:hypothetical protein